MSKERILRLLIDQKQPITSKMFAKYLDISSRTVINYIKEINYSQKSPIITSDHQGYSASVDKVVKILKEMQENSELPQNFDERSIYILRELLFKNSRLNIYDFSEELFISVSTLKNDVYKTNKIYEKYNCTILYDNECIYMSGTEEDKRSLLSYIIRRETVGSLMDLNILKELFNDGYVNAIKSSLDKTLNNNSLFINDYAYMNFLLHLSIIVDNANLQKGKKYQLDFTSIGNATKELYELLEDNLDVKISQNQLDHINSMLNIQLIPFDSQTKKNIEDKVDRKTLINAQNICNKVNTIFFINICRDDFLLPFAQHLENLVRRLKKGHHEVNPMTKIIKRDNPVIYEIAVYIMSIITKTYKLDDQQITEDEIAFIALHVGSAITKNNHETNKLKAVIICPKYRDTRENLVKSINDNFSNVMVIKEVISYPHEIGNTDYDILIKTIPDDIFMPENSVLIDLIDFEKNRIIIQEKITNTNKINNTELLIDNFDQIFDENLFFNKKKETKFYDKFQVINYLGQNMVEKDLISGEHLNNIIERESMSSTAFGNIAIPHALEMNAYETSISVLVSREGIKWDDDVVNIVLLFAINHVDMKNFKSIYQGLLTIFEGENIPFIAKQLESYDDLKHFFTQTNKFIT